MTKMKNFSADLVGYLSAVFVGYFVGSFLRLILQ